MAKKQGARYSASDGKEVYETGVWFDSVEGETSSDFVNNVLASTRLPKDVKAIIGNIEKTYAGASFDSAESGLDASKSTVFGALFDSVNAYRKMHNESPSADLIAHALRQGALASELALAYDDVTTGQSKSTSYIENQIRVAMYSVFKDAIPFAYYLPVDGANAKSNKQPLAIVQPVAASDLGRYKSGDSIFGGYAGKTFLSAARTIKAATDGTVKFTDKMTAADACDPTATVVPLVRGLTTVLINGFPCAREIVGSPNSTKNTLSGSIKLADVTYTVAGEITFATGVVSVTTTPSLPANTAIHVRAVVDYENHPELKPVVKMQVLDYAVYSEYTSCVISATEQQAEQIQREFGVDIETASQMAVMGQFNLERYKEVLWNAEQLSLNNNENFDFDWANQKALKSRADAWENLQPVLAKVSQKMAVNTQDHGVTHIYVDAETIGAELSSLRPDMFMASGAPETATIAYSGILFGKYKVYSVAGLGAGKMLCIGRSEQSSLCPFVVGDVVPPKFVQVGRTQASKIESTLETNGFTAVNPHQPAAMGCAMIKVINL